MNYKKIFYFISVFAVFLINVDCRKDPVVKENLIALTFDDGPDANYTPKVLNILKEKNIKASFFIIGKKIIKYPEMTKRIFYEGHFIGNHTYNHFYLKNAPLNLIKSEIWKTQNVIDSLLGSSHKYVRMPFGAIAQNQSSHIADLGYKIITWDVDPRDWDINNNTVQEIVDKVISQSRPGKIILLHCADYLDVSSREKTIAALPEIIDELHKKNYKFVTIENL